MLGPAPAPRRLEYLTPFLLLLVRCSVWLGLLHRLR
jgi:hypothetical protein